MKTLKIKLLRLLVVGRNWANTERGGKIIVRTLTIMTILMILDLSLLAIAYLFF